MLSILFLYYLQECQNFEKTSFDNNMIQQKENPPEIK